MASSSSLDGDLIARLHTKASAARWALSPSAFAAALEASVNRAFDVTPDRRQLEKYLDALHLDDLALAWACADGSDAAWEHVMREHRPALYRAADAIDHSNGRELADSL